MGGDIDLKTEMILYHSSVTLGVNSIIKSVSAPTPGRGGVIGGFSETVTQAYYSHHLLKCFYMMFL